MAHHLTHKEREIVAQMHHDRRKQCEIARRLKRHPSTISRELRRNSSSRGYWALAAQRRAETRRSRRPMIRKLQRPETRRYVRERLRRLWSPDEIAYRSHDDFSHDRRRQLSHQTIYAWIRAEDAAGSHWRCCLRSTGWKRKDAGNRGRIPHCTSIAGRPAVVDRRRCYGDWEGDTLVGANRRGGAVSLVERKSGYLLLARAGDLHAPTVCGAMAELYRSMPPALRKTLTLDNGKEFAEHERLAAEAALKVYFADPYCAWQRGTNENTNALSRQFFPKGTDLAKIPKHRFTKVQQLLNDRPQKRLGYRTPSEVLGQKLPVAFHT
jgi:IS30 family transposase